MGVYSGNRMFSDNSGSYALKDTLDSIMEDSSVEESQFDDPIEGGYNAIYENAINYNNMMKAVGIQELAVLESTGEEMVYTEGAISDFFTAIKKFLLKIWDKIKGLFKHFMAKLDVYLKSDKEFVTKYKKDILKAKDLSDFTFKGWKKFTPDAVNFVGGSDLDSFKNKHAVPSLAATKDVANNKSSWDDAEAKIKNFEENRSDIEEAARAEVLGESGKKYDAKEFHEELMKKLHGGDDEKEELSGNEIQPINMLSDLETSKETKKSTKKAYDDVRKAIDSLIKDCDKKEKEFVKAAPGDDTELTDTQHNEIGKVKATDKITNKQYNALMIKLVNIEGQTLRLYGDLNTAISSAKMNVINERSRQYKSCCVALMHYKPKSEAFGESAGWHDGQTTNFLGSITFR